MHSDQSIRDRYLIRKALVAVWVTAFTLLFCIVPAVSQSGDITANTSVSAVPASPTPIPLSSIVSESDALSLRLREIRARLAELTRTAGIGQQIPVVREAIDSSEPNAFNTLISDPSLDDLRSIEIEWQKLSKDFPSWKRQLLEEITELGKYLVELEGIRAVWEHTSQNLNFAAEKDPKSNTADIEPRTAILADVEAKLAETIAAIADIQAALEEQRSLRISTQARVSDLESRTTTILAEVSTARERGLANLFRRDSEPIWNSGEEGFSFGAVLQSSMETISTQVAVLRAFAASRTDRFALNGLIFFLVAAGLYWARGRIRPYVKKEPKLETASQIFELPIITALIVSVLVSNWFYPQAPRILYAIMGAAVVVPVVILLRRLVDRSLYPILNILVVFYIVDRLREILSTQPLAARILFLAEMFFAIVFLFWFMKSKVLKGAVTAENTQVFTAIRRAVPAMMVIVALSFLANILGFVSLSNIIGEGLLRSSYAALLIYTITQIARSVLVFALRVPPLSRLSIVKNNRLVIRNKILRIVYLIGLGVWVLLALNLFSIREAVFRFVSDICSLSLTIGSIDISIGDVVIFLVTVTVAVLISRFIRFILEEDVYPRIDVESGTSYSISTVLHYGILMLGLLVAIAALGVDFTKFAIVAGAVGIGVGFGLQQIINNFVSGLILLFERPVKVGDTVQLGEHVGTLKRVGLRASILRKIDGSDVVVPNSLLISEEVINWTMTDKRRRVEIPVGVAYGSDPERVIELLTGVTVGKPDILQEPEPKTFFLGFGDNSLDFELRFWTENTERWVALRSELVMEIYHVLDDADIEIPFPQRDLHVRSNDREAIRSLADKDHEE